MPPVEEVIPDGEERAGTMWCRLFPEERIQTLLGEGDMDRVRQVGDLAPGSGASARCEVVWADGDEQVRLAWAVISETTGGGPDYVDALGALRDMVGKGAERLSTGQVAELETGLYFEVERASSSVFLACEAGKELPVLLSARADLSPTETGEPLTTRHAITVAANLHDMTAWVHPCEGTVVPLGPDEWEPLMDRATGAG